MQKHLSSDEANKSSNDGNHEFRVLLGGNYLQAAFDRKSEVIKPLLKSVRTENVKVRNFIVQDILDCYRSCVANSTEAVSFTAFIKVQGLPEVIQLLFNDLRNAEKKAGSVELSSIENFSKLIVETHITEYLLEYFASRDTIFPSKTGILAAFSEIKGIKNRESIAPAQPKNDKISDEKEELKKELIDENNSKKQPLDDNMNEEITDKNNSKGYETSFDDSSDEEDSIDNYNIISNLHKIRQVSNNKLPQDNKLSFLTYAFGLQLLYSKPIQKEYYLLKKLYLSAKPSELPDDNSIKQWIFNCFNKALETSYFRLPPGNEHIVKLLCNDFSNKYAAVVESAINETVNSKREIFRSLARNKLVENLKKYFVDFDSLIKTYIKELSDEIFQGVKFAKIKAWSSDELEQNEEICERIKGINNDNSNIEDYIERLLVISDSGKIQGNKEYKNSAVETLGKLQQTDELKAVIKVIKGLKKAISVELFKEKVSNTLLTDKLKYLAQYGKNSELYDEVEDLLIEYGFIELNFKLTRKYIKKNTNDFEKMHDSLEETLAKTRRQFIAENLCHRKILDDSEKFDLSNEGEIFFYKFLATLRLCNRSVKRLLKDRDDLDQDYGFFAEEGLSRAWQFPCSNNPIIDIHSITAGRVPVRKDHVVSLGKYEAVFNLIKQIKDSLNRQICTDADKVRDEDIAYWISLIISGDSLEQFPYSDVVKGNVIEISQRLQENILKDLAKITYLMFGCEVMRNPAALIYNYMTLDLIEKKYMSWKEALDLDSYRMSVKNKKGEIKKKKNGEIKVEADGGMMPMSMKDAVMAARSLHEGYGLRYAKCLPNQYTYDRRYQECGGKVKKNDRTPHEKEAELVRRESQILVKWLRMKLGQEELKDYFDSENKLKDDKIYLLFELIKESCKERYNINIPKFGAVEDILLEIGLAQEDIDKVSDEILSILAVEDMMNLIKNAESDFHEFIIAVINEELTEEDAINILSYNNVTEVIKNYNVTFDDILRLYNACSSNDEDFEETLESVKDWLEDNKNGARHIDQYIEFYIHEKDTRDILKDVMDDFLTAFNIYSESTKKFYAIFSRKVYDLLTLEEADVSFDDICNLWGDEDQITFWDLINDDKEIIKEHGFNEVLDVYNSLLVEHGRQDEDGEENNIYDMTYDKLFRQENGDTEDERDSDNEDDDSNDDNSDNESSNLCNYVDLVENDTNSLSGASSDIEA